jgi:thiol-disulfide isomerase/thioredoxin
MRRLRFVGGTGLLTGLIVCLSLPAIASAQDIKNREQPAARVGQPPNTDENIKAINDDYARQLLELERRRMERLERLAAGQNPAAAGGTYEQLFRLAIANNMFGDAERAAKTVLSGGSPSRSAMSLAHLVKIITECDRGDHEHSLESLRLAVADKEKIAARGLPGAELSTEEIVGICDAYYQRLLQSGEYEKARKAVQIILGQTRRPVVKEFLSNRLKRLDLVGKPAPAIQGTDIVGKPFNLADARGKVVLVVFWASWYLPSVAEIESLTQVEETFRGRGLQIVGINLDAMPDGAPKPETVLPTVRRFLLDHDVDWPTLMNGQGEKDYAKAYGVTEIPANALIARDGTVANIDLVAKNLEPMVARAIGR